MEADAPAAQLDALAQDAQDPGSGAETAAQESSPAAPSSEPPPEPPRVATALPPVQANMMVCVLVNPGGAAQRDSLSPLTPSGRCLPLPNQLGGLRAMGAMQAFYAAKADFEVCVCVRVSLLHLLWPAALAAQPARAFACPSQASLKGLVEGTPAYEDALQGVYSRAANKALEVRASSQPLVLRLCLRPATHTPGGPRQRGHLHQGCPVCGVHAGRRRRQGRPPCVC